MGRAKKLKELRRAARTLPPDFERAHTVEVKPLRALTPDERKGLSADMSQTMKPETPIKVTTPVAKPVNHYRKMKQFVRPGLWGALPVYADFVRAKHEIRKHQLNISNGDNQKDDGPTE